MLLVRSFQVVIENLVVLRNESGPFGMVHSDLRELFSLLLNLQTTRRLRDGSLSFYFKLFFMTPLDGGNVLDLP